MYGYILWFSGFTALGRVVMSPGAGLPWGTAGLGIHDGPSQRWQEARLQQGAQLACQQERLLRLGGWVPAGSQRSQRSKQKLHMYFMTLPPKSHSVTCASFCGSGASEGPRFQDTGLHRP